MDTRRCLIVKGLAILLRTLAQLKGDDYLVEWEAIKEEEFKEEKGVYLAEKEEEN